MGYRFLDDYDPRKETKKKQQNGALSAPRSGNSLNPFAANNKKPSGVATGGAQTATAGRTTRGTALGGSAVTPVQMPKLTVPKLTKTTTAQKTAPVKAPQQLKLPTIQAFGAGDYTRAGKAMDRAAKTVKAGAVNAAAGAVEIAGQFRPTTGQQSMGQFSGFGDLGRAVRENRAKGTDINESIRRQEQQRRVRQKQSQQNIFAAADRLTEKGQQYEREAKQGLGTVGQFLVDMGVTGTQMAGDALANLLLPGSGLAMMGMRSYGQAAGEARRQGKNEQQQFLAGLKSAGIEVFTEKMFGAFSKVYGGAAADELVEKLVSKMTGNATGQALLTWIINGVGEGVEEVTSDLLNPLTDRLLRLDDGKGGIYSTDDLAQWGYDFLLGAAMGIVGGSVQLARGVRQGQAQTAESNYYDDLRRNGLGSANAAGNARRASAAMGRIMPTGDGMTVNQLRVPTLTDAQGRTYEQRMAWQQIPETQRAAFDEAQRIAQRFGAQVTVNQQEGVNGSYREGVISLNPNAANPVRQTLIHELTHHMESSGLYSEFSRMAMQYVAEDMGADVDSLRQAVVTDYAQNGVTLDEDGANREIVAKFAEEKLFTDEATVRRLLAEDRSLFQRIYDWIRDALGKLTGTSEENFLREAEKLYAKALREATAETGRNTQMLFAGVNARTANMQTLARAEALEAGGVAAEDIRRETGWFRGMDGKWRFEIDDSGMQYDRQGVTQNPDVQRKRQLEEKLLYGQLTQEEANELRVLTEATRGVPGPRTLGDYIQHDALFEAYPELRDAAVVFEETEPGANGYYNAGQNTIVLDSKLRGAPESTLVHEIQHAVQRAEGFAGGATPSYWKYKNKDGQAYRTDRQYMEAEQRQRDAFDAMPDTVQDEVRRINRAKLDQDWDEVLRLEDDIYNGPYAELYSAYDLADFDRRSRVDYYKGANYVDLYTNTAGEIEARDAANRRSYDAEQRRQLRPDLGNKGTVFADGTVSESFTPVDYSDTEKKQHVADAKAFFGRTYKWSETGYITTDGARLDFSGKHEGGPGGYRTVDHRDIRDALGEDYGGDDYSGAMIQFMREGNIRMSPESGGINLSVMPTKAQMDALADFIGRERGEVILDLDDANGNTLSSTEYPRGTHSSKVLNDIRAFFETGATPQVSELGQFRYSTGRGLNDIADNDGRRLQAPRLTTYEERETERRAAQRTARVENLVDNIDALHEAVDNGLRSPRLTTYEEREAQAAREDADAISRATAMMDRDFAEADRRAREQRAQQEQQGREMPEALKKLGVEPFGSEADYAGIDNLAQEMRWNSSARKQAQRQMNKIPATEKERTFARRLADGTLDAADIPNTVNRETVETLADHYRTLDSTPETVLLRQRRAVILEREEAKMEPLLGMDVAYDEGGLRMNGKGDRKNSGKIAKQTSTLRRNLQTPARICATEWGPEHGKKVYEALFYPVTENNGRQIDWVNSMLDRVRTFKDSKGEERPLNRKERELVQKIVEHRGSEDRVAAFDTQYKGAVENVRNGASAADAAKEFGIDPSYQEYQDLQNYETYLKALEDLHDSKSADDMAVGKAVDAYSKLYRELYDGINSFLVAHGYQPIGFIEGYAPHMQPEAEKTAFSKALKLLGLDDTAMSLPTSISGKTADLKPYKQYNPFFQERHGVNTEYDIAKGFEDYVYYLGNIFYHTDDIMRIRTAEKYIRKTYSSEEASELINQAESARDFSNEQIADFLRVSGVVQKGTELAPGDARVFLEDYIGKLYDQVGNVTRYSEMAKYLDNYANRLAGKQNMADRGAEAATGRGSLNWINTLTGKYGGAKLAFNVSSALNQTSQIPMVAAENGEGATARAIGDFFKSKKDRLDFVQASNFLKGKKGIDWLLGPENGWEKFKEAGFTLTEMVDSFTSFVAVRSKYLKETKAGKNHAEAMKLADEYGRNVMGSRARGEKPMLFDTKNPFWQIVTRFQLEALNSWEHVSRDMPNEVRQMAREQGKAYAAGVMGVRVVKYLLYGFLLNLGIGALSGGSPVPYDVIGSGMEALGKSMGMSKLALVGELVDNVLEAIFDKRLFGTDGGDDDDAEKDWWAFVKSLAGDMANDIPIIGQGAAMLGIGDQTLATADLSKVGDFAKSVKKNGLFSMDTLDKGATAAGELFYAGNQARKTLQGGIAVAQGGVYSNGKLRYQVDQTPGNILKGVLFGRSALDESQAYYAERTSDFSENQTEAFKQMQDRGVSAKASYDLIRELKEIEKTDEATEAERRRDALRQSGVSGAGKWVAYYQTMASETEVEAMDAVQYRSEADYGTVTSLLMDLKEQEKDADKMRLIDKSNLSDSQKASLYKSLVARDEDLEKINALKDAGISDYQYLQYRIATSGLTKKEAKLHAINMLDLDNSQKDALYYLNSYASSTHGDAPWVQGVSAEQSDIRLAAILAAEEDDGDDTPKWLQSLNSYLGKESGDSEVSKMLENARRLRYGSAYASSGDLAVSQMLANVRRLRYGASSTSGVSGGELSVEEMLANVRRRRAELGV